MRRFAAVIAASSVSNVCVIPSLGALKASFHRWPFWGERYPWPATEITRRAVSAPDRERPADRGDSGRSRAPDHCRCCGGPSAGIPSRRRQSTAGCAAGEPADVGKRLPVRVSNDTAARDLVGVPRRRKAAWWCCHASAYHSPDHPLRRPPASAAQLRISGFSKETGNIRTGFAKTRAGPQKPPVPALRTPSERP